MSEALDTAMMASMREAIKTLLPDTCDILRETVAPDGMGGVTATWATVAARVPFRLDMKSGSEVTSAGAIQPYTFYKGSLPYDTVLLGTDRIQHKGITYGITSINASQSWEAVTRVDLEKL